MIRFPNAKINLGLRIVARRPDGYHNIETVFYPVQLQDALEIVPTSQQETELSLSGIVIDGDPQNNLVMKAWRRLSHTLWCWVRRWFFRCRFFVSDGERLFSFAVER